MNNNNKFTPGPWEINKYGQIIEPGIKCEGGSAANGDYLVCDKVSGREMHLISAAPELLEALEKLLIWANISDGSGSVCLRNECMDAIRKAKGE